MIPRARGRALQTIQAAEGYKLSTGSTGPKGEAARFDALYAEYRKAPEVTRKRIYLETMSQILPKMGQQDRRRRLGRGRAAAAQPDRPRDRGEEGLMGRVSWPSSSSAVDPGGIAGAAYQVSTRPSR